MNSFKVKEVTQATVSLVRDDLESTARQLEVNVGGQST